MSIYPKTPYQIGFGNAALYPGRTMDHIVAVKADLPCTVIAVHGVNDVGVSYGAVEAGLCAGMARRLELPAGAFKPNDYRDFTSEDRKRLEDDPDAIFFKRTPTPDAHSFVVPFYWGYRASAGNYRDGSTMAHGQHVDRHGNRLDKDYSKEGGPFANATNSLPDVWNKGFGGAGGLIDKMSRDALRPVLDAPGRMYMVLAAQRLAALVQMIRDYDDRDTINIVAHSQGTLLALLAQAFLLQDGRTPADTLVLHNSPYSLEDELPLVESLGDAFKGGVDAAMKDGYAAIAGVQTLQARLQTLVQIVRGAAEKKNTQPEFQSLQGARGCTVGTRWSPEADRDNRGKTYLYFSPEDATVALNTMRGIGWQGVPDRKRGYRLMQVSPSPDDGRPDLKSVPIDVRPLSALGPSFLQRVFTKRLRPAASGGQAQPVLLGAPAPHDFSFCLPGEERYEHVNPDLRSHRGELRPTLRLQADTRDGIRTITGEALERPVAADLDGGATAGSGGKAELADAIDAAVATTSDYGREERWTLVTLQADRHPVTVDSTVGSPRPDLFTGSVNRAPASARVAAAAAINGDRSGPLQTREVLEVYRCLEPPDGLTDLYTRATGQFLVHCKESFDEARLRWQSASVSRSFHSAIFGSAFNHEHVTAYDLAIGQGKAVSDPKFRAYLCAIADWRVKVIIGNTSSRPGILMWTDFQEVFADYYTREPVERARLIEGNCTYYSTGVLPDFLPVLPGGLPPAIVSETNSGNRIEPDTGGLTPPKREAANSANQTHR